MRKILTLLLTVAMLLTGFAFAEASVELDSYPMVDTEAITLTECEPFEIDGMEVLELVGITFNEDGPITAKFTFLTEFTGDEMALICFDGNNGLEGYIFDDALFDGTTVTITFPTEIIVVANTYPSYLAIAKVTAVG